MMRTSARRSADRARRVHSPRAAPDGGDTSCTRPSIQTSRIFESFAKTGPSDTTRFATWPGSTVPKPPAAPRIDAGFVVSIASARSSERPCLIASRSDSRNFERSRDLLVVSATARPAASSRRGFVGACSHAIRSREVDAIPARRRTPTFGPLAERERNDHRKPLRRDRVQPLELGAGAEDDRRPPELARDLARAEHVELVAGVEEEERRRARGASSSSADGAYRESPAAFERLLPGGVEEASGG